MKKIKNKQPKEIGAGGSGKVVKLKPAKPRAPRFSLPPIKNYIEKTSTFLGEVVTELKLTTWPNRKEVIGTTGVTLILVLFIAIFLGLVDYALSHLVQSFIH
ncbi:MAG: preprotein translocase subunit SecE [Desulfobaccales bacterium]|jgi:preprotein translocase subunit SecE